MAVNGLSLIIIPRRVFSQRSEPALTTCCQVLPQKKKAKPLLACLIPFPKKESNGRLPMGEDFDLKENWTKPLRGGGNCPFDALSVILLLLFFIDLSFDGLADCGDSFLESI
jgi:hypothetical protein